MEWRKIPGVDSEYEASDEGQIRSFKVWRGQPGPRILNAALNKVTGYFFVQVCVDGKLKVMTNHRLVALAFLPNPKGIPQVNHIDRNRQNNRLENLEWVSEAQNSHHSVINGGYRIGQRGQRAKMSDAQVEEIRRLVLIEGRSQAWVARAFGIGHNIVSLYMHGYRSGGGHVSANEIAGKRKLSGVGHVS